MNTVLRVALGIPDIAGFGRFYAAASWALIHFWSTPRLCSASRAVEKKYDLSIGDATTARDALQSLGVLQKWINAQLAAA